MVRPGTTTHPGGKQTELVFYQAESPPLGVLAKLRNLWREQDRGKALYQETPRLDGEGRIPSVSRNSTTTSEAIAVAEALFSSIPPLSPDGITRLQDGRLIRVPRPFWVKIPPIEYAAPQDTYARMLAEVRFSSQFDLARHLGISDVRGSRVLSGIKGEDS